jgi:hypothetical protein
MSTVRVGTDGSLVVGVAWVAVGNITPFARTLRDFGGGDDASTPIGWYEMRHAGSVERSRLDGQRRYSIVS